MHYIIININMRHIYNDWFYQLECIPELASFVGPKTSKNIKTPSSHKKIIGLKEWCWSPSPNQIIWLADWGMLSVTTVYLNHLTNRLTDSMTSMKTSFFLYLMPSDLQDTALVTVAGGRGAPTSSLCPCWVMYLVWKWKKAIRTR